MGTYPVPADRFQIIFPYTAERDRSAWRWSWGAYGEGSVSGPLTTGEMRKLTGKAAEITALLTRLPLDTDFFQQIEADLVDDGLLNGGSRAWDLFGPAATSDSGQAGRSAAALGGKSRLARWAIDGSE